MKKLSTRAQGLILAASLTALGASAVYVQPYVTAYKLVQAANHYDLGYIALHVDLKQVRDNFRESLVTLIPGLAQARKDPKKAQVVVAFTHKLIDPIVDKNAEGHGLVQALKYNGKGTTQWAARYVNGYTFQVAITDKKDFFHSARITMTRYGMTWKITRVDTPLWLKVKQ